MARALRLEFEGALDHICARGNRRGAIFEDDRDRIRFLKLIEQSLARYEMESHAYVLLRNHFHLLGAGSRAGAIH
jgi:REP element-mobilizing transposase RayT